MKQHKVLKYILDIISVIEELEILVDRTERNYINFSADVLMKRAAERDLEIIGEALNKMLKADPELQIQNAPKIIGLRNIIAHAYDSIDDEIIWGILIRHLPALKEEILQLKSKY